MAHKPANLERGSPAIPILLLTLAAWLLAVPPATAAADDEVCFAVIVHSENPVEAVDSKEMSRIMTRKMRRWPDETQIVPIDQPPQAETRRSFSKEVLGRSVSAIEAFWQRQIFSGRAVPPEQRKGDAEVIATVSATPGAIGYVGCRSLPAEGVRTVEVTREGP